MLKFYNEIGALMLILLLLLLKPETKMDVMSLWDGEFVVRKTTDRFKPGSIQPRTARESARKFQLRSIICRFIVLALLKSNNWFFVWFRLSLASGFLFTLFALIFRRQCGWVYSQRWVFVLAIQIHRQKTMSDVIGIGVRKL